MAEIFSNDVPFLEKLYDARQELLNLQQENIQLRKENDELKQQSQIQHELKFYKNLYRRIKDGIRSGPYCVKCWDGDKNLVRLHEYGHDEYLECKICKTRPWTRAKPE